MRLSLAPFMTWLHTISTRIIRTSFDLFKVMIPVVLIVKLIEELGGIELIAAVLEPVMQLVGLPATIGLVWAATLITNIYGGMIIFIAVAGSEPMTVAEVTVLGTMMLFAHSLPIETSIARKAGVYITTSLVLRFASALLAGIILNQLYIHTATLSGQNSALWMPVLQVETGWGWALFQLKTLVQIFVIIAVLVTFLDLLRMSGIERFFIWLLQPVLRFLGLDRAVTSMTIVGMTLGLTYGGALLINEAKYSELSVRQVLGAMVLISICHGLIEDTLLVMMLGAHISGVLAFRVLFSLLVVAAGLRWVQGMSDTSVKHYLAKSVQVRQF